jgi:hypothetical protein
MKDVTWELVFGFAVIAAMGVMAFCARSCVREQNERISACISTGISPGECRRAFTGERP